MSIIERLRHAAGPGRWSAASQELLETAATEIEELRGALEYIWDRCGPHIEFSPCADAVARARKALGDSAEIIPINR